MIESIFIIFFMIMKEKREEPPVRPGLLVCLELNSSVHSFIHSFILSVVYIPPSLKK